MLYWYVYVVSMLYYSIDSRFLIPAGYLYSCSRGPG